MIGRKSASQSCTWELAASIGPIKHSIPTICSTRARIPQWGFCGVGLLKHDARIRDVMLSQDCLYTLVERSLAGDTARIIGSIVNFAFAPDDPQKVIEQMASANTRIVSLTITEGGYYIDQSTGELDAKHPDLQHDLAHPHEPSCSFGYLLEALDRRRLRGLAPFTANVL